MKIKTDLSKLNNSIQTSNLEVSNTIKKIPIDKIIKNENNFYSIKNIEELSENIKVNGLITPLIVTKVRDKYKLISGHRRLEAIKLLDKKEVEAIIMEYEDDTKEQLALLEANSQRILTKEERDYEIKLKKELYEKMGYKNISKIIGEEYNLSKRSIERITEDKKNDKMSQNITEEEILLKDLKKLSKNLESVLSTKVYLEKDFKKALTNIQNYIEIGFKKGERNE